MALENLFRSTVKVSLHQGEMVYKPLDDRVTLKLHLSCNLKSLALWRPRESVIFGSWNHEIFLLCWPFKRSVNISVDSNVYTVQSQQMTVKQAPLANLLFRNGGSR